MNCEDLNCSLSRNEPLTADAVNHLETCPKCRGLASALATIDTLRQPDNVPDAKRLVWVNEQIRASLHPVRALPSDRKMVGLALVVFVAFSMAVAAGFGYYGLLRMNGIQRIWYCGILIVLAWLLSFSVIRQIVPGSKRRWDSVTLLLLSIASLSSLVLLLFGSGDESHFVHFGVPCLLLGLFSAMLGGLVAFLFLRKGYAVTPIEAGSIAGCLAGLAGVAVLALHCPRFGAAHIVVWHLSGLVIACIGGAIASRWWAAD